MKKNRTDQWHSAATGNLCGNRLHRRKAGWKNYCHTKKRSPGKGCSLLLCFGAVAAVLPAVRRLKTVNMENLSVSSLIESYKWSITNNAGVEVFTTDSPTVNYTFADTGVFKVRLDVNPHAKCADSAYSVIKVYPGLKADFTYDGVCLNKPTLFTDATSSVYSTVNSWQWSLSGDASNTTGSNTSNLNYNYASAGQKQ